MAFSSTLSRYFAQCYLASWYEEGDSIAEIMLASIDYGYERVEERYEIHKIMATGRDDALASWFILELYCISKNKTFDHKKANYPTKMYPYDEVLSKWDTNDLIEVDRFVALLSEKHLEQRQQQKNDGDWFEFGNTFAYLFPYEILTWLKLRERAGLKNPKTFTHPLMNTPIAKMFLAIKEPLPIPTELPYAKELLEKLQEKCPDVEVHEWVEGNDEETQKENNSLPEDFLKE